MRRRLLWAVPCLILTAILIWFFMPQLKNRYDMEQLKSIKENDSEAVTSEQQSALSRIHNINSDTVGWIRIPNTFVDCVMVQCENNKTYEETDFYGGKSKYGTIFVDANCLISTDFSNQNTTIYGHNMKDGQMFGSLKHYRTYEYYRQHPLLEIQLMDSAPSSWRIFTVFITGAYPNRKSDGTFEYRQRDFESQEEFIKWANECKVRSLFDTPVDILPHDQVLTLSTCTYEYDDARLVVMARRMRAGGI